MITFEKINKVYSTMQNTNFRLKVNICLIEKSKTDYSRYVL